MKRYLYEASIEDFCSRKPEEIHGILTSNNEFNNDKNQKVTHILETELKNLIHKLVIVN